MLMDYLIVVNFSTIFQIVIFCGYLLFWRRSQTCARYFIIAIFVLFLLSKSDDLLQQTMLISRYPSVAFLGNALSLVLGPLIWLYVLARTQTAFEWRWRNLLHAVWGLLPFIYLYLHWWRYSDEVKLQLLASGDFANTYTLILLPGYGDTVLVVYLLLSVRHLVCHGASVRQWFSNTIRAELLGLRQLLTMFAVMVFLHILWIVTRGWLLDPNLANWAMAGLISFHLILLNGLFIEFLNHKSLAAGYVAIETKKSDTDASNTEESRQLMLRLDKLLQKQALYLDPDLTIAQLAKPLNVHFRTLSLAINTVEQCNFFEFINRRRIAFAATKLLAEPQRNILDIAYSAGFNSKSAFNTAFRRYRGMTPSQWRKQPHV